MGWQGKLIMWGMHVAGIAWCGLLFWLGGWWLVALWLALGAFWLFHYIRTWTDTPAIWWWPYLIMCWPITLSGGIVLPLR